MLPCLELQASQSSQTNKPKTSLLYLFAESFQSDVRRSQGVTHRIFDICAAKLLSTFPALAQASSRQCSAPVTCLWYGFKFYIWLLPVCKLQHPISGLCWLNNVSIDGNSDAGAKIQSEFLAQLSLMDVDCRFLGYKGEESNSSFLI